MTLSRFNPVVLRVTAAAACLYFAGNVLAQAGQPSLDDLLDLSPSGPAVTGPASDTPRATQDGESLTDSVQQALSASQAAGAFEQAVREMGDVSRRLGRALDPGVDTQRMQESILRKLDQVIESAKQQQSSSGSGGGSSKSRDQDTGGDELAQQQQQPASGDGQAAQAGGQQASSGAAGSGSPQDPEAQDSPIDQLRREWGTLPPRLRDELTQGLRERFSPLYRDMTEAYYKALAEQE